MYQLIHHENDLIKRSFKMPSSIFFFLDKYLCFECVYVSAHMPMFLFVCMCTEGEDKLTFFLKDDKLVFCLAESGNRASHWPRAHK